MLRWCVGLVTLVGLSAFVVGDDAKPAAKDAATKEIKKESSISKDGKKCACSACTMNFGKELGVPLGYLSSLGHRIHEARMAPDPVELAMSAQSLAVAEKVAGKKASMTSQDVMKEAITLAKQRGFSAELAALQAVVSDEATQKDLGKEFSAAKKREDEEKAAVKSGEATKELVGSLYVVNRSNECVRIFVSGRYCGTVHAGRQGRFHIHDHNFHTEMQAICEEGGEVVDTACAEGHNHRYVWYINP